MESLEKVLRKGARLVFPCDKIGRDITSNVVYLFLLPLKYCIVFKMFWLVYKSVDVIAQSYMSNAMKNYKPSR